jgi:ribonuclease HI
MFPKIINAQKIMNNKIYPEITHVMKFDGCSKGNPGIAGAGAVIYLNSHEIWSDSVFVGNNSTNNEAEYQGLILGLKKANELDINNLIVEGDSLLVINHMNGTYKCKSPNLIELYNKSIHLSKLFNKIYFNHIYRNENKRADELSNIAVSEEYLLKLQKKYDVDVKKYTKRL